MSMSVGVTTAAHGNAPLLLPILLIILALTAFDGGEAGRLLRRWLVELPARRLSMLSRDQIIGLMGVMALALAAALIFEVEGLRLFAMAAPEMTAWVMMFDVTVVFEMAVLALSLKAVQGWRVLVQMTRKARQVGTRIAVHALRNGRRRARRMQRPRPPRAGSDDFGPAAVFA